MPLIGAVAATGGVALVEAQVGPMLPGAIPGADGLTRVSGRASRGE